MKQLALDITEQMAVKRLSVALLAQRAKVARVTIYKVIAGKSIALSHLLLILEALDMELKALPR